MDHSESHLVEVLAVFVRLVSFSFLGHAIVSRKLVEMVGKETAMKKLKRFRVENAYPEVHCGWTKAARPFLRSHD